MSNTQTRFCKLDDAGNELAPDATTWSQVLDRETNLIWCADPLDRAVWKKAIKNAARLAAQRVFLALAAVKPESSEGKS